MTNDIIVGIDLGTTFSAIAYINKHGKPEIIPPREGVEATRTTPSVVYFGDDGQPVVGIEARRMALIEPHRVVRFVKREMGNPSYRFNVDGKDHFPEDLSAMILKKLKSDAEAVLGEGVSNAVVSVPAYFKDAQREATRQAGTMAGLNVLRIVNEPTAAALAYGFNTSQENETLLVYDFGGGTFDVTIMRVKGREFTTVATDGDAKLGGKDIDGRLLEYFADEFRREHGIDLRAEPHTHQDLWDKAEIAKKDLSFRNNLAVTLSSGEKTLRIDLGREKFVELIQDLITQTEECMQRVIAAASMNWSDIHVVLLAGGSSRIPAVREMIQRVTGKDAARDMNPDECVALGAAIQGTLLGSEAGDENRTPVEGGGDIVVHDVATHSLGVRALAPDRTRYVNSVIIPRFSPIPSARTRTYATNEDNQKRVEIEVLQGEDEDPRSPDVQLIGKAGLSNLPPHKAGELVIEVTLQYDANGVIEVVAREHKSGQLTREVVMQKAGGLSAEIVKERQKMLAQTEL